MGQPLGGARRSSPHASACVNASIDGRLRAAPNAYDGGDQCDTETAAAPHTNTATGACGSRAYAHPRVSAARRCTLPVTTPLQVTALHVSATARSQPRPAPAPRPHRSPAPLYSPARSTVSDELARTCARAQVEGSVVVLTAVAGRAADLTSRSTNAFHASTSSYLKLLKLFEARSLAAADNSF